jgi:hypothetical protein
VDLQTPALQGEAMTELDRIRGHEEEARARIDQVGQQARAASAELAAARERLVEFERAGAGRPADRRRLEEALAAAEARAAGSSSVGRPQPGSTSGTGGCISMNAC